jgi:hypothetical protein
LAKFLPDKEDGDGQRLATQAGMSHISAMGNSYVAGISVVIATKDGRTNYWAAAVPRDKAIAAVQQKLPPGWTAALTSHHLTARKVEALNMRPNSVHELGAII